MQKQLVQCQGKNLKGTDYDFNEKFPCEILNSQKVLFQIRKQYMKEVKKGSSWNGQTVY